MHNSSEARTDSVSIIKLLFNGLEIICGVLSPMTALGFLIFLMIGIDYFGQHAEFLTAIEKHGIDSAGVVAAYDPGDSSFLVIFDQSENGLENVFLYTRYYSPATLNQLKEGDRVRVRYTIPEYGYHAVLLDHYNEVKNYSGYFKSLVWPLLFCLFTLVIAPAVLYTGLELTPDPESKAGEGIPSPLMIAAETPTSHSEKTHRSGKGKPA